MCSGRGSLFELLSTNRTAAGERFLAGWLLAPGDRADVIARQGAVEELRPRIDLREDIAVMGEEIRAAADDRVLKEWGAQPPRCFLQGRPPDRARAGRRHDRAFVLFMIEATSIMPPLLRDVWRKWPSGWRCADQCGASPKPWTRRRANWNFWRCC